MSDRVFNFSAGPATLPLPVLEKAQRDLLSLPGFGASPLEVSHRSPWFEGVIGEAEANLRHLLEIPETHHVVFCQSGATMQFSMVAMNLLRGSQPGAAYVITGAWGAKAVEEARKEGVATVAWSGEVDGYTRVPEREELERALPGEAAYVHVTSNETIHGVEFSGTPFTPTDVPLVCDTSSDFLSRPVDVTRYGLLYAGAQKNAGPAGVAVVIVRDDLLARPPVFAIYVLMLVTRWLRHEVGGLQEQHRANREKAGLVHDAIDGSEGFYLGHAELGSRSLMNVTWRLPSEDLERRFVTQAAERGLTELKGHRSVGGIRASLYNAMPRAGAQALADLMDSFAASHG